MVILGANLTNVHVLMIYDKFVQLREFGESDLEL